MAKVFIVVGHRHWGKSTTLRTLSDGKYSVLINDQRIPIKRMSNDDPPLEDLLEFIRKAKKTSKSLIIIALCPDFATDNTATKVLNELKGYEPQFWVIRHSQNPNDRLPRRITEDELDALRGLGRVEIFSRKGSAAELAKSLRRFIENSLSS
jgi:hypothetical protein